VRGHSEEDGDAAHAGCCAHVDVLAMGANPRGPSSRPVHVSQSLPGNGLLTAANVCLPLVETDGTLMERDMKSVAVRQVGLSFL